LPLKGRRVVLAGDWRPPAARPMLGRKIVEADRIDEASDGAHVGVANSP
jgi:hypothetical protein